jgi:tripartite-type tricarboxylate transporter receptor subunit TctC
VTSWGLGLPPGTPAEVVEVWNAVLQAVLEDPDVQAAYAETGFTVLTQDVEQARQYFDEQYEATRTALEAISG